MLASGWAYSFLQLHSAQPGGAQFIVFQTLPIFNSHLTWDGETPLLPMKTTLDSPGSQELWNPEISCHCLLAQTVMREDGSWG